MRSEGRREFCSELGASGLVGALFCDDAGLRRWPPSPHFSVIEFFNADVEARRMRAQVTTTFLNVLEHS